MTLKLKIMLRAVKLRLERGEDIETILASYPALKEDEKKELREAILPKEE